jgi:hypothetical protein
MSAFNDHYSYQPNPAARRKHTEIELGFMCKRLDTDLISLIDAAIASGQAKIPTIRFFRNKFTLLLEDAKGLYEAREKWLANSANPYGF